MPVCSDGACTYLAEVIMLNNIRHSKIDNYIKLPNFVENLPMTVK